MARARIRRRRKGQGGWLLLETVIAILIMTTIGLALIGMIQRSMVVTLKARERISCMRLAGGGFARLRGVDFYHLFAADSAAADYGLWGDYPYKGVLADLQTSLERYRFDRFRVSLTFMRRDISDANGDGSTADLIEFVDADSDGSDDYDPNIRFFDQNGDTDYYDTYTAGGRTVAEQPDTHIKRMTLDIFRRGRLVCSQTGYVSLEGLSGEPNPSSEAVLKILLSTPTNASYLYSLATPQQQAAWALPIVKSYPAELARARADLSVPMPVAGETDPLAVVRFYVGGSGELDNATADFAGNFSNPSLLVTAALVEGENTFIAQATKDAYTSPITRRALLLDLNPPAASGGAPTGAVATYAPYVSVDVVDAGVSTTAVSGICPDVVRLSVNGVEAEHRLEGDRVVWIDSVTQSVPVLSSGTYNVAVEAGDYAGYKTSASWTFTVDVPDTDHSAPSIANPTPSGMAGSPLPEISAKVFDNQSGVIPASIEMKLDGAVVVDAANIGENYDPAAETVSFTPAAPFVSGTFHTVEVSVGHWATDPADKITNTHNWGFWVP